MTFIDSAGVAHVVNAMQIIIRTVNSKATLSSLKRFDT